MRIIHWLLNFYRKDLVEKSWAIVDSYFKLQSELCNKFADNSTGE